MSSVTWKNNENCGGFCMMDYKLSDRETLVIEANSEDEALDKYVEATKNNEIQVRIFDSNEYYSAKDMLKDFAIKEVEQVE